MVLTVIFRDDSPMSFFGDSPSYRSVCVALTPEQVELIKVREVGVDRGNKLHESISSCFIEPDSLPGAPKENTVFGNTASNSASMAIFSELSKRVASLESFVDRQKSLHSVRG